MQMMMNRWKDKLSSIDQKQKPTIMTTSLVATSAHPPKPTDMNSRLSIDKNLQNNQKEETNRHRSNEKPKTRSKKQLQKINSQSGKFLSSSRVITPAKNKKSSINPNIRLVKQGCEDIIQLFAKISPNDKDLSSKLQSILQRICFQYGQCIHPSNDNVQQIQTSISLKQSVISSTSASKKQEKLYKDLEFKYFEVQKQKHYLKKQIEEFSHEINKQTVHMQHFDKIDKLVENCIAREEQAREDTKKYKALLCVAELREVEQQRVFQKQIESVRKLVDQIRKNLPAIKD